MASNQSDYTFYARVPLDNTILTVNVKTVITRQFRLRMWCGIQLIKLAGLVLGCNIIFEGQDDG